MNKERKFNAHEFTIEGAEIIFKNFSGKPSDFNKAGDRNFGLILNDDIAEDLKADGWNVKYLKPRDDDPTGYRRPWLQVKVKYGKVPPIVVLITSRGKTKLKEETVSKLDYARFKNVDLIVRPYNYPEMPGRPSGISAYLKSIYVTLEEDDLEKKYGSIPDDEDMDEIPFD